MIDTFDCNFCYTFVLLLCMCLYKFPNEGEGTGLVLHQLWSWNEDGKAKDSSLHAVVKSGNKTSLYVTKSISFLEIHSPCYTKAQAC